MAGLPDILNAVGSAFGVRTEKEPAHEVLATLGPETGVRRYPVRRAYEVRLPAEDAGRAFDMLFRSIREASIPMTSPVESGTGIPMTAPVEGTTTGHGYTMRFFLPDGMADPPPPTVPGVTLIAVPGQTLGVRRFAGLAGAEKVSAREGALRDALRVAGWTVTGARLEWYYDPPWAVPPLRRNEVALPVERAAG